MAYKGNTRDFPAGNGGLNGNLNIFRVPITDLVKSRNIRFDDRAWTKVGGLQPFDTTPIAGSPILLAGADWRPSPGVQRQITAWSNGEVYKEVGGDIDNVQLATGLNPTSQLNFVEGGDIGSGSERELYVFGRGVTPQRLVGDANTLSAITAESVDWAVNKPLGAVYHDAKIYAFGVSSAPHNLYASTLLDHGNFSGPDARVFEVQTGIGNEIRAAFSYLPETLFLFKFPVGIMSVNTTDTTSFFLPSNVIRRDIGVAGPGCVAKVQDNVFFISSNGRLYLLNALRPDVDPRNADITTQLNLTSFIQEFVNINRLDRARLVYDEFRNELLYCFSSRDSDVNDSILIFDFNDPQAIIKASTDDRGRFWEGVWPRVGVDGFVDILSGGEGGLVYENNALVRNINNEAYTSEFAYAETDFSDINPDIGRVEKNYDFLEIEILPTGNFEMTFDISIDGENRISQGVSFEGADSSFDNAIFDSDEFSGRNTIKRRVEIGACGNKIGIGGFNSGLNQNFQIVNIRVYYRILGDVYES